MARVVTVVAPSETGGICDGDSDLVEPNRTTGPEEPADPAGWRLLAAALIEREISFAGARTGGDCPGVADSVGRDGDHPDLLFPVSREEPADPPMVPGASPTAAAAVARAEVALDGALEADGPFRSLVLMAELEPVDVRVLALCAGVELDRRLQRLVGLLQHDLSSLRLEIDLVVRLLGPAAIGSLADDGRLARAALLELEGDGPLAAARITVPRRVAWALLDDLSLDPDLPAGAELLVPEEPRIGLCAAVLVSGADRVRRVQAAVGALAGGAFLITPPPSDDAGWRVLVRQATLGALSVVLECTGPPTPLDRRWIERADHLPFAVCTAEPIPLATAPLREFVDLYAGDPAALDAEWHAVFPHADPPGRRPTATELQLASRVWRLGDDPQDAFRRVASVTLLQHARRVTPEVGWDDLVLAPAQERQLRGLIGRYRNRRTVHDDWNLPLYPSPGLVALFSGPSGTGKSTAAQVIAGALGVDMFRVDLSALVSKYIGETEKNLEEIFSAAGSGGYLLLFEEADALFGARSKVTDARDRYANMEVSYLLQRLETYDGFVVLTSNFQGNIDEAFLRRIHVAVHFSVPTAEDRRRIWERSLAGAPLDAVDLDFVAQKFDLTGGSIRMAALASAYLAADRGAKIGMAEILYSSSQELTKLRRRTADEQFGPWLAQVNEFLA